MLPKHLKLQLRKEKDFFSSCKRQHSQFFSIFYKNKDLNLKTDTSKVVVLVPKKQVNLSSQRNKLKRMFYKALQNTTNSWESLNLNLVFIVKYASAKLEPNELEKNITKNIVLLLSNLKKY